jgi:hypothetical protein
MNTIKILLLFIQRLVGTADKVVDMIDDIATAGSCYTGMLKDEAESERAINKAKQLKLQAEEAALIN